MLSIIHKKAYQDFLFWLRQLENYLQSSDIGAKNLQEQEIWLNLSQIFQQQIISLTDENLEGETASSWISLQTELQREFRLLKTDWLFWVSARQPATKTKRSKAIVERLQKLITYCQILLS
jgi:hypothetical protein